MLHIHLFGSLRLQHDDQPQRFSALPKTLPLFAYLLLNTGASLSRAAVAFALWPDAGEETARNNLRRHLYELRRVLPPAPDDRPWLLVDNTSVQWNPDAAYWLDVAAFLDACCDEERLADAVTLYQGDLLPTVDEEWLLFERERLRSLYLSTLWALIERRQAAGDLAAAIGYAATLLRYDPLREDVVRTLMSLRAGSGDLPGALLEYRRFAQELRKELDVPPTAETAAHYDALARQVLTLESVRPAHQVGAPPVAAQPVVPAAAAAPARPRHNLPAPLTSFVGRAHEIAELRVMLTRRQDPVRLLTLIGPGGSGKTRLALEAAVRLIDDDTFPDGIFLVSLSAITDVADVPGAIASAIAMTEESRSPLKEQLVARLAAARLLLVLDNFEHVSAAAPLLDELLAAAPALAILVTSRVALRIYGEQEFPVAPLPLPELDDLPSFEELARTPAVELFTIRSRAVNPSFTLRREDAAAVAEICTRLDGLPLAIELAAARSKLYPPRLLLTRLSSRLTFLESRARDAEHRHQTLRATLDWSYRLLGRDEQRLLARLAVFAQGCSLEAAEAVCAGENDGIDVFASLSALCDHSMIHPVQTELGVRFELLATVHEYAADLLAADERARLQQRHAEYYASLAQQAGRALYSAQQTEWIARIKEEEDNLRAALRWSLVAEAAGDQVLCGTRIARGLARYWQIRGRIGEARAWFALAVRVFAAAPTAEQVEVLGQAGYYAQLQGDHAQAFAYHEEALSLARASGDETLIAFALYALGSSAGRAGHIERSIDLLSECLALRRRLYPATVTDAQMALTLNNLAVSYVNVKQFDRAEALQEESLALKRRIDDKVGIATSLANLADLAMRRGDLERTARLKRESIELRAALNDQLGLAKGLDQMAELAVLQAAYPRAALLFAAATAAFETLQAQRTQHVVIEYEELVRKVRSHLSDAEYARAAALGSQMSLDDAVRYALAAGP